MKQTRDTFALTWHDDRGWFYIPTVPEARAWRGPYPTSKEMVARLERELGGECYATFTTVNGPPR